MLVKLSRHRGSVMTPPLSSINGVQICFVLLMAKRAPVAGGCTFILHPLILQHQASGCQSQLLSFSSRWRLNGNLSIFQWTVARHCGSPNVLSVSHKQCCKGKKSLRLSAKLGITFFHHSLPLFLILNGSSTCVVSEINFQSIHC